MTAKQKATVVNYSAVYTINLLAQILRGITLSVLAGEFDNLFPKLTVDDFVRSVNIRAFIIKLPLAKDEVAPVELAGHVQTIEVDLKPSRVSSQPSHKSYFELLVRCFGGFAVLSALSLLTDNNVTEKPTWLEQLNETIIGWRCLSSGPTYDDWIKRSLIADKKVIAMRDQHDLHKLHSKERDARYSHNNKPGHTTFYWHGWVADLLIKELAIVEKLRLNHTPSPAQVSELDLHLPLPYSNASR